MFLWVEEYFSAVDRDVLMGDLPSQNVGEMQEMKDEDVCTCAPFLGLGLGGYEVEKFEVG